MGLFDSLRSKRNKDSEPTMEDGASVDAPADIDWFKPRTDGIYLVGPASSENTGTNTASDQATPYLRFNVTGRVQETWTDNGVDSARQLLATASDDRAEGEFSRGGLMSVARRFERPVVYAVQDSGYVAAENGLFESFTARCTNTNTRETSSLSFTFSPDGG